MLSSLIIANGSLDFFQAVLNSTNLQIFLLIGSGLVAIALLTLTLTRLGASRPLWKCIILSVMAHILLIGFLWGTRLIAPLKNEELTLSEPMRVNYNEDQGEQSIAAQPPEQNAGTDADSNANWDGFGAQPPLPALTASHELQRENTGHDFISPPVPMTPALERSPKLTAQPLTPAPAVSVNQSLNETLADRNRILKESSRSLSTQQQSQLIAQLAARPIERNGNPDSSDLAAIMPKAALQVDANTFEKGEFTTGREDDMQAPAATEGVFEAPAFVPPSPSPNQFTPQVAASELTPVLEPAREVSKEVVPQRRLADGQLMPRVYAMRSDENRMQAVLRQGGSRETEAAVQGALKWLADNQSRDGRWNPRLLGGGREDRVLGHDRQGAGAQSDSGITALALLAFMANGHTHLEGPYQHVIQSGLEYLVAQQVADGDLAGKAKLFARMYCHSMSLLAISEAYAITGDRRLAVPVQRGVNYSIAAQNPRDGGWRYQPRDEGDMSQFGWQAMALHSAEIGGIDVPRSTKDRMVKFLDRCCISPHKGIAAYRVGQGPNTTMTAEALFCRDLLGQPLSKPLLTEAHGRIGRQLPSPDRVNMYYWYYGTLAMYVSGGDAWQKWNQQMKATLLSLQVKSGVDEGSWEPNGLWAGYGGRTYSTAMAALTLEVYYRYLPVYDVANRRPANELR